MNQTEIKPVVKETISPLKASEAMRLGAMITGQAKGFIQIKKEERVYTCALGAIDAGGGDWNELLGDRYIKWPKNVTNYQGTERASNVCAILNDAFNWTREEIADYLESQGL